MSYDSLIRNGTIVDGSGRERFVSDVAIKDGRIAKIGAVDPAEAGECLDADGLIVSPGFVDCHTHYDAQLFWDPLAMPSSNHGVTTIVGGLCGFTIQPMTAEAAGYLLPMLSKVEDIPMAALAAGVPLDWTDFRGFRSSLQGTLGINAGFATGHSALRRVVMGDRAKGERASADDLASMKSLLRQSLADGSLGLSTSNSATHNDHFGEPVPSRSADHAEFVELASVCREFEGSQVEIQPGMEFDEATTRLLSDMSLASRRTVNWNAMFTIHLDEDTLRLIDRQLAMSDYARERGGRVVGLTVPVTGGVHVDLIRGCGFFDAVAGWEPFFRLSVPKRVEALRDPSYRANLKQCIDATLETSVISKLIGVGDRLIVELGYSEATKRFQGQSMQAIGRETGRSTLDTFFDIAAQDDLRTLFSLTPIGEDAENYRKRLKLWRDDRLCVGGSDAGAHVETIDTFNYFTRLLARPVRELGVLSLEECVHQLTQAPARLMGIKDRGELRVGAWADIAIFDKDTVDTGPVQTRNDFPAGAPRLFAEAIGIERVMVRGRTVLHQGRDTGARPGQFLERARDTYTVGIG